MQPVIITFRDMPPSKALERNLIKKAEKLTIYCNRIQRCRIFVSQDLKRQRHGHLYNIHIELSVPGKYLDAHNKPDENFNVAVRSCFEAARRQLEHYLKKHHHRIPAAKKLMTS